MEIARLSREPAPGNGIAVIAFISDAPPLVICQSPEY
jgi:hypothetical protein